MSITNALKEERRIINAATLNGSLTVTAMGALRELFVDIDGNFSPVDAERLAHSWNALPLRNAQVEAAHALVDELNQAAEEARSSSYGQMDATWARMQGAAFAYEDAAGRIRRAIEEAGA